MVLNPGSVTYIRKWTHPGHWIYFIDGGVAVPFTDILDLQPHSRDLEGDFPLDGKDLDSVTDKARMPVLEATRLSVFASQGRTVPPPFITRSRESRTYFGTKGYLVMDFIPGQPLDKCWADLTSNNQRQIGP
jgi:hypothetical protein